MNEKNLKQKRERQKKTGNYPWKKMLQQVGIFFPFFINFATHFESAY